MKKVFVHLISDSTGDTLLAVARAIFSQFDDLETKEYLWTLVLTSQQLEKTIKLVEKKKGMVLHTIANKTHILQLEESCKKMGVMCINVLGDLVKKISEHIHESPNPEPGKQHIIDEDYFKKIDAINFSIAHDDGQYTENMQNSDIILVGPSRSSKSPTSMYLAYRGYKTANIPFVLNRNFPDLGEFNNSLIIGLSMSPNRMVEIRKNRLASINENSGSDYANIEKVTEEVLESKRMCLKNGWPIIDVSNKSVEEIAAKIIQEYFRWKKKRKAE
jgi:[pyruvate, water dikinase]-phosphate phosphotransferase / [pyruvate, water dikinase] kinase